MSAASTLAGASMILSPISRASLRPIWYACDLNASHRVSTTRLMATASLTGSMCVERHCRPISFASA